MTQPERWRDAARASHLRTGSGVVGLLGCLGVALGNLIGILVVERHNPISETISKLAIGRHAWIQDLGLDLFAAGVLAVAVGLYAWRSGGAAWKTGLALLLALAVDLVLIAEHNQYADRPPGQGGAIHIYLVYALYGLFSLATLLLAFGLQQAGRAWRRFSLTIFAAWTVLAPVFFVVPTSWDGAYERFLGAIMLAWFATVSWLLLRWRTSPP